MIAYMNKHHSDKYHFRYSTPSNYIDALAKLEVAWPTKYDDLFPYADNPDAYWTGYFSARANDKEYIRRASHNFHASSQLYTQAIVNTNSLDEVSSIMNVNFDMLDKIGIAQHHDAVTGTAKQAVADDYTWKLFTGMQSNNIEYSAQIAKQVKQTTGFESSDGWQQCTKTNTTYLDCPVAS